MKFMALMIAAGFVLAGCGGQESAAPTSSAEPAEPAATSTEPAVPVAGPRELNIGDIEAEVKFEVRLDADVAPAGVTSEELSSQKQKLNLVTVTVEGARPAELWLRIDLSTQLEFPERPVAARGRLIREVEAGVKETLFTFETIFDDNASARRRREGGDFPPQNFRAEVMQGLSEMPETMLLYGEMDVVIMPKGTDPATLDPATARHTPESEGLLLSNPVRINYVPGSAPAPEMETAPAIGLPAPETAGAPVEVPPTNSAPVEEAPVEAAPAPEN